MSPKNLFFLLLWLLLSFQSEAQYRRSLQDYYYKNSINSNRFLRRLSLGLGKHYLFGTTTLDYNGWDTVSKDFYATSLDQPIKLKNNVVGYIGSFFPITTIGDNSMFVVNTELMASYATLTYDSVLFLGSRYHTQEIDAYKIGMMLSIEYRMGGDVPLNKSEGAMFTLGAGVNPCVVSSTDFAKIPPAKFIPFIKGELGFFAGMAVKVRGIIYFGNSVYADETSQGISNTGVGDELKTYMSGINGFDIALILMPFSVSWNSGKW